MVRRSIGASLSHQLKSSGALVLLGARTPNHAPSPHSAGDGRQLDLVAVFPRPGKAPQRVDLSFLAGFPNLADHLLEGYRRWGATAAISTRASYAVNLRIGFCGYLQSEGLSAIGIAELASPHLVGFVNWLNRGDAVEGKPYSLKTRDTILGSFRAILRGLEADPHIGNVASALLRLVPKNNWPGSTRKSRPRERLSRAELAKIIEAAEADVRDALSNLDEGSALISDGLARQPISTTRPLGTNTNSPFSDKAVCLAALDLRLKKTGKLLKSDDLKATNIVLFNAAARHGLVTLTRYLYPQAVDLVPFVILLAVASAFNAETAVTLAWSGVVEDEIFGTKIIRLSGPKMRAADDPVLPLPAESVNGVGIGLILDLLKRWTSRVRPFAPPQISEMVFLFSGLGDLPTTFANDDTPHAATTGTWHTVLGRWCKAKNLERFKLSQIRTTILDEVQQRTGDILQARALGRHRSATTTWRHYTSDGTRKRLQERLGEILMLRERWFSSKGVIDPRERTEQQDMGSATPGFLCFDPYDSPQPGQKSGRLCSAYGRCPSCPLAAADIGDEVAVACFQALRRSVVASEPLMSTEVFTEQWRDVLFDLDALLANVAPGVRQGGSRIRISLPPVG